jgi:hypothetical protein
MRFNLVLQGYEYKIDGIYPSKNILQKYEFIKCLWSYMFLIQSQYLSIHAPLLHFYLSVPSLFLGCINQVVYYVAT